MLRKIREMLDEREQGFTLIELLVVVIIIGILAAIAIPVFLNQRENAWRSAAESDVRNAAIEVESFLTANDSYPTEGAATVEGSFLNLVAPDGDEITTSPGVALTYTVDGNTYCITAAHQNLTDGGETAPHAAYDSDGGGVMADPAANCGAEA